MKRTDRKYIQESLDHLEVLHRHLSQPTTDRQLVVDAAALRLSAAIDSLSRVSEELRQREMSEKVWRDIKSMRNRIAHAYAVMDASTLDDTFDNDIAAFEADIRRMLEQTPE
ncbi:HepT-like ribonuclease domain-containing protein [Rathayibacter soli]|uniref:HepT-like ribonuclease domain-containing protein n=1 Tax=Rathayibacter soli TaxID=3144168 RepID=UPI0027E41679|nr:HepT-like ribonuclease domain-containing protein [Glaciibacter superstes]